MDSPAHANASAHSAAAGDGNPCRCPYCGDPLPPRTVAHSCVADGYGHTISYLDPGPDSAGLLPRAEGVPLRAGDPAELPSTGTVDDLH